MLTLYLPISTITELYAFQHIIQHTSPKLFNYKIIIYVLLFIIFCFITLGNNYGHYLFTVGKPLLYYFTNIYNCLLVLFPK